MPEPSLGPRLDLARFTPVNHLWPELVERLACHTRHCRSCSLALVAVRRWRALLPPLALLKLLTVAWFQTTAALGAVAALAAIAGAAYWKLGEWERCLLAGTSQPPRNRR